MKFAKRSNKGFALILVLLIGALMMVPALMLLSAAAPRRTSVTGEAVSDIALASADGVVDKIATKISTFPTLLSTDPYITSNIGRISGNADMARFAIGYLLSSYLNGGDYSAYSDYINHLSDIQKAVSTYLYDMKTQKYYAVWSSNRIKSVGGIGPTGDIAGTSTSIQDLSSNAKVSSTGIGGIDSYWSTDNRWIEIDTNTQFDNTGNDDAHSKFTVRATAYLLSSSNDASGRMRTVQAEVSVGHVKASAGGFSDQATGAFTSAVWSGTGLINLNSTPTINGDVYGAGDINIPSGGKITGNVQAGGALTLNTHPNITGNVFAAGSIGVPAGCTIGGNIQTGGSVTFNSASNSTVGGYIQATNSITTNTGINLSGVQSSTHSLGGNNVVMSTGVTYTQPAQSAPTFNPGTTSAQAMSTTQGTGSVLSGDYNYSWWNNVTKAPDPTTVTIGASGSTLPSYISGSVYSPSVILNFAPISGSATAWYVGGNVNISGTATLNFTQPCIIVIHGALNISNTTTIKGHGTIIADSVNFTGPINGSDTSSKIAIITGTSGTTSFSNPVNLPAIIYAPNGAVEFHSGGTITGSIVAKNGVTFDSGINLTYDSTLTGGGGSPLIPGPPGIAFKKDDPTTAFKRSWKELISGKYTITPFNMGSNFTPPSVDSTNSDYSS